MLRRVKPKISMADMWRHNHTDKRLDIFEKSALIGYYKNPELDGDGS